ncbi:hypothetical protein A9Q84_10970 [Halobacteriovorax marinus]|uniref:Phospholipase/carboxylesterase/thioesterase domain-containing protein n=1 Tax=Halobacteriovorax marinus TaxID=97084 RepID=A0A1Y5FBL6_9BACT|nr:hypothetical protein A9Q84_10970 [Halobacteriovorax marinus]
MISSKHFDSTFLPAKLNGPKSSTKIMIVMHGLGDHKSSFVGFAQEINITGLDYLLINAPKPYYFGFSWYDIPPGNPITGIRNSIQSLSKLISELNDQGYQDQDIFIAGFSQGGCIALHSFLSWERNFAGIICLSPRIYLEDMDAQAKAHHQSTPLFIAHGHQDQAIEFEDVDSQVKLLKSQGLEISWHEYTMDHEICIDEIMALRLWLNDRL